MTGLLNHIKDPMTSPTNDRREKTSQLDPSREASTMHALKQDVTERHDCRLARERGEYGEVSIHTKRLTSWLFHASALQRQDPEQHHSSVSP